MYLLMEYMSFTLDSEIWIYRLKIIYKHKQLQIEFLKIGLFKNISRTIIDN